MKGLIAMTSKDEPIEVVMAAPRLTEVLSRVAVDLNAAMQHLGGAAMLGAALRCKHCATPEICDAWLATHEEGEGNEPPEFCPSAQFMRACKPGASSA
jgi:hypothetical protein